MSRFYGGVPVHWLFTPIGILQALMDEIPKLDAEHRLNRLSDMAVATGNVKKGTGRSHMRTLERALKIKPRTATAADLEAMGISVHGI